MKIFVFFAVPFLIVLNSCMPLADETKTGASSSSVSSFSFLQQPSGLTISNQKLYLNGTNFFVKSVGFEPFMPGESPEDGDVPVNLNYAYAFSKLKQANVNATYLLTGDPANLQPAFFQEAVNHGIYIILGLWFDASANDYAGHSGDFQNSYFKGHVTNLIRQFIDRFHNMNGTNYSSQILYLVIGNELYTSTITATAAAHPAITSFNGNFVKISNANATECFLAEMMDYMKTFEASKYNEVHYVTHHNWIDVWPLPVTNRFLDIVSFNLYSYWPSFMSGHSGGSGTGTPYQGALEEISSCYPDKPFVVSEFGISVAPSNVTTGTNNGGQSNEIYNRWTDMTTANRYIAGCSVHELFDQWWKDDGVGVRPDPDKNEHDPTDREEYFGVIGVEGTAGAPVFTDRPAYLMISNMYR